MHPKKNILLLRQPCDVMLLNLRSKHRRGVDGNQGMARIVFLGIQIFWLLLLGTLGDAISKVVLLKYLRHQIYFFCMHADSEWNPL
jgi:hypothetical protein